MIGIPIDIDPEGRPQVIQSVGQYPGTLILPTLAVMSTFIVGATLALINRRQSRQISPGKPTRAHQDSGHNDTAKTNATAPFGARAGLEAQSEAIHIYKELYFKLQHLEQYPEVLPQARDILISLFSETLVNASQAPNTGILSINEYSQKGLADLQRREDDKILDEWEQYLARRSAGGPREMFQDKDEAKWWLTQSAPVKYVDGAWLGHINKITTPFALRKVVKNAWQVLSEELGDGDLEKNHVHIYRQLMASVNPELPAGDAADFIHPRHQLNDAGIWKASLAQLLISLFPHQFLPEILGFNMHYEAVALETLKVSKELKELQLDPYYFILHVSIDNSHSGHTAMAVDTVIKYMELIQLTHGNATAQQTWKRIQAGFILSKGLPTSPSCPTLRKPVHVISPFPRNTLEGEVIEIFKVKAEVAHKIHCGCKFKIGRHTLVEWLGPDFLTSKQRQTEFLDALSNTKPWIIKGDSKRSRFIQALLWGGKMFGSFTPTEIHVVEQWINSMGSETNHKFYWKFINQNEIPSHRIFAHQDIRVDHPVYEPIVVTFQGQLGNSTLDLSTSPRIDGNAKPNPAKLLPLWFTHPCLLEHFICVPAQTTTALACSVLRMLRAQSGFAPEGPIVAGMDEVRRTESIGLVELGLEIVRTSGFLEPGCLKEVLDTWESDFALLMLQLCKRPIEHAGLLLGLAMAFTELHEAVAESTTLLSDGSRKLLADIARRERMCMKLCLDELRATSQSAHFAGFCRGYHLGKAEIEKCFDRKISW